MILWTGTPSICVPVHDEGLFGLCSYCSFGFAPE